MPCDDDYIEDLIVGGEVFVRRPEVVSPSRLEILCGMADRLDASVDWGTDVISGTLTPRNVREWRTPAAQSLRIRAQLKDE